MKPGKKRPIRPISPIRLIRPIGPIGPISPIRPIGPIILLALLLLASCRRDMWVYTDEYCQVALHTDWSQATETPGGMTWWFMADDHSGRNRRGTTADVTYTPLSLPRGQFTGVVFDYSPAEYAHIEFLGMTRPDSALAHISPSADQPLPNDHLFGPPAVPDYIQGLPQSPANNGMYLLSAEPETLNADTLQNVVVTTGLDEDLVPWQDRDKYVATVIETNLYAEPRPVIWKLYVRVPVRGANYMHSLYGTIVGLTDGFWLVPLRHTSTPCMQLLDRWSLQLNADSLSHLTASVNTFGLTDPDMPMSPADTRRSATRADDSASDHQDDNTTESEWKRYSGRLRLNLQFTLRDEATVLNYHYDLGEDCVTILENKLIVSIDIPDDYPNLPDLPYVDVKGGTGFDATVTPWGEGGSADTTM